MSNSFDRLLKMADLMIEKNDEEGLKHIEAWISSYIKKHAYYNQDPMDYNEDVPLFFKPTLDYDPAENSPYYGSATEFMKKFPGGIRDWMEWRKKTKRDRYKQLALKSVKRKKRKAEVIDLMKKADDENNAVVEPTESPWKMRATQLFNELARTLKNDGLSDKDIHHIVCDTFSGNLEQNDADGGGGDGGGDFGGDFGGGGADMSGDVGGGDEGSGDADHDGIIDRLDHLDNRLDDLHHHFYTGRGWGGYGSYWWNPYAPIPTQPKRQIKKRIKKVKKKITTIQDKLDKMDKAVEKPRRKAKSKSRKRRAYLNHILKVAGSPMDSYFDIDVNVTPDLNEWLSEPHIKDILEESPVKITEFKITEDPDAYYLRGLYLDPRHQGLNRALYSPEADWHVLDEKPKFEEFNDESTRSGDYDEKEETLPYGREDTMTYKDYRLDPKKILEQSAKDKTLDMPARFAKLFRQLSKMNRFSPAKRKALKDMSNYWGQLNKKKKSDDEKQDQFFKVAIINFKHVDTLEKIEGLKNIVKDLEFNVDLYSERKEEYNQKINSLKEEIASFENYLDTITSSPDLSEYTEPLDEYDIGEKISSRRLKAQERLKNG